MAIAEPTATRSGDEHVTLTRDELEQLLAAIDLAYEAAVYYSDLGRVDFEPFRPLAGGLLTLRAARDREAAA